ncbi:MAG: DUF4149 domain-containing protein [Gemmatimonadota bacterium]|nr:DUF4149 domain-containing protein [Gemmatimonadota bacterium]
MNGRGLYTSLVSIALLAAWLGVAVFVAAVIAPAAFAVLPTRALAGALVGRALPVLFISGVLLGGMATAYYATSARITALGGLLLLTGNAAALMIERRLHDLLTAVGAPIDTLAMTDARRVEFGRLHGLSVLMMGVGVVGASIALVTLARRIHANGGNPQPAIASRTDATSSAMASSSSSMIT